MFRINSVSVAGVEEGNTAITDSVDNWQTTKWVVSWDHGTFRLPLTHSSNAHAQPSSGARCLIFCWTLRLLPYLMYANSDGSGETARMRRLAWAFAGRLCDKYHNLMSWLKSASFRRRVFAYYHDMTHPHSNIILHYLALVFVLPCAAKILKIGLHIKKKNKINK